MSIVDLLSNSSPIASAAEGGVKGFLSGIGKAALELRAAFTGQSVLSPEDQAAFAMKATEIQMTAMQLEAAITGGQLKINEIEAQAPGIFKGGWRPFIGWVCGAGLGYDFVLRPVVPWLVQVGVGLTGSAYILPVMPMLDLSQLMPLVIGMLGLGTLRTFEKYNDVAGGKVK